MSNVLGTSFATSGFTFDANISPNNQSFSLAVRAVTKQLGLGTGGGGGGTGSVTSVAEVTAGGGTDAIHVTGSPITTSGTLTLTINTFAGGTAGVVGSSAGGTNNFLRADGSFAVPPGTSTGSVTSVSGTDASNAAIYTFTNVPITTGGTFSMTLLNQPKNSVFAGPTAGANAQPQFRGLGVGDVPHFIAYAFDQVLYSMAGGI